MVLFLGLLMLKRALQAILLVLLALCFFPSAGGAADQGQVGTHAKARAHLGLYLIIWEVTVDKKGKLATARIAKIIAPNPEGTNVTPGEIPEQYQLTARKKLERRKYEIRPKEKIPVKFFTSSYYDPQRPGEVITKLPSQ